MSGKTKPYLSKARVHKQSNVNKQSIVNKHSHKGQSKKEKILEKQLMDNSDTLVSVPFPDIFSDNPFTENVLTSLWYRYFGKRSLESLLNKLHDYYNTLLIEKDGQKYLKRGTILYHGDLGYPFVPGSKSTGNRDAITFFGLDYLISIWYILELIENMRYSLQRIPMKQ